MKEIVNTKYNTKNTPNWCPGCGDFGIWTAFKQACLKQSWDNSNTALVAGIGCHGHIINFVSITNFEGLHGRPLPIAEGMRLANKNLNVFVFTGDGDCLAEGGNHFLHACRRNMNITVILHDNAIYGLTTGQTSPRSPKGYISKSTPEGNMEEPLNPISLAISSGATFVARAYSGDIEYLRDLITLANKHKGFAIIDVLQPCVTFNKQYSHYFFQKNIYNLQNTDYDFTNKGWAFVKSLEWGENQIPVGIFYQVNQPTYEEQLTHINKPLFEEVKKRDISELLGRFM